MPLVYRWCGSEKVDGLVKKGQTDRPDRFLELVPSLGFRESQSHLNTCLFSLSSLLFLSVFFLFFFFFFFSCWSPAIRSYRRPLAQLSHVRCYCCGGGGVQGLRCGVLVFHQSHPCLLSAARQAATNVVLLVCSLCESLNLGAGNQDAVAVEP